LNSKKNILFLLGFFIFSTVYGSCPENYTLNPLFSEGSDDYEECIPSDFIHYSSSQLAGYFFIDVKINEENITSDDWVGAFNVTNQEIGACVGSKKWNTSLCGEEVCDLIVYGVDGSGLTSDYMLNGSFPLFKIFEASSGKYYSAFPTEDFSWSNMATPIIDVLQACTGGTLDLDNDDICDEYDQCVDPDNDEICGSDDVCPYVAYPDGHDWDYNTDLDGNLITQEQCINGFDVELSGGGVLTIQGVWDNFSNTCGDGVCDNNDDCVGIEVIDNCILSAELPSEFILYQNYPNPFNPYTIIEFSLSQSDYIDLVIYDLRGNKVRHLINNDYLLEGLHKVKWDGKDDHSQQLSSSNYIVFLKNSKNGHHKKITLIK